MLSLFAVVVVGAAIRSAADRPDADGAVVLAPDGAAVVPAPEVRTPRPAPSTPAGPSVVVLCSDLSEHRLPVAAVSSLRRGAVIDFHGSPCIVLRSPGAPPRLPSPT